MICASFIVLIRRSTLAVGSRAVGAGCAGTGSGLVSGGLEMAAGSGIVCAAGSRGGGGAFRSASSCLGFTAAG